SEQEMAEAIRPLGSERQHAAYLKEAKSRSDFKRQIAVNITVELLDRHLALTDDQRATISARLLDKWEGAESISIATHLNNPQYLPQLPEALVQPHLDATQRVVWSSLNKVRFPLYLTQITTDVWDEDF